MGLHDGLCRFAADRDAQIAQTGDHAKDPSQLFGEKCLKRWLPVDFNGTEKHSVGGRHQNNSDDRKAVPEGVIQAPEQLLKLAGRRKRISFAGGFFYKADSQKQDEHLQGERKNYEKAIGTVQESQNPADYGAQGHADALGYSHAAAELFQIPAVLFPEIVFYLQSLDGAGTEGAANSTQGACGGQHEKMAAEQQ